MEPKTIVFAINPTFLLPTLVAVYSVLSKWSGVCRLQIVLASDAATFDQHCVDRFEYLIAQFSWATFEKLRLHDHLLQDTRNVGHLTVATYFRLLLSDQLPKVREFLYLDGDVLALCDISDFPRTNDKIAMAAIDPPEKSLGSRDALPYCSGEEVFDSKQPLRNCGVMVINAERWRRDRVRDRTIDFLQRYSNDLRLGDQDAINAVCGRDMGTLPPAWNRQVRDAQIDDPTTKILHFTGKHKPWNSGFTDPFVKLWLREAKAAFKAAGIPYWPWRVRRDLIAARSAIRARLGF